VVRTALAILVLTTIVRPDDGTTGLLRALRDPDRGVRYAAVQALGRARVALPQIVTMLDDPEWCVRQAAGAALMEFGEDALQALTAVAHDGTENARVEAVDALSRLGAAGVPALLDAFGDPSPRVVAEACDGLWRCRDVLPEKPSPPMPPMERLLELA
jgi:HEAT repeat protein